MRQYLSGELELEFNPQGTLAERPCARVAQALPAFTRRTGVGTQIAEGKEHKEFNGETFVLETGHFLADLSIVKAWKADYHRQCAFSARPRANFNPARRERCGARLWCWRWREIVEPGTLDPDAIHLPGIYGEPT